MTVSIPEIRDIKTFLVDELHKDRIKEQKEDLRYYEDTFELPLIKDANYIVRTGAGARLVDNITEQIVSSNPQVFRAVAKETATAQARALEVGSFLNLYSKRLNRQIPNPYKEAFKNQLVFGETWLYVLHNEDFKPEDYPNSMPFHLFVPSPLIAYEDIREGNYDGVPNRVLFYFERTVADIRRNYPLYIPPQDKKDNSRIPFLMYFDNEVRYFEASDSGLLREANGDLANGDGIQENVYGLVSLVHAYSGFGKDSPDGNPVSLAVGRLRKIRGIIREECTMRSNASFIVHKYAHRHYDIINRSGTPISPDQLASYDTGPGIIQEVMLPEGAEIDVAEALVPPAEVFTYFGIIRADLAMEDPPSLRGLATGTSGRQEDILRGAGLRLYDSVVFNTAHAFATALGLGLRIIKKIPNMLPPVVKESDIGDDYTCRVELKADDPIEKDRLSVAGRAMVQVGQLSLRTNLIKHQGMTEEEADDEIDQILAERYMFQSPEIAELMQIRAAEKAGMAEDVEALKQRRMALEKQIKQFPLGVMPGSRGGEPRTENIQTMQGMEEADLSRTQRGQRTAPL